MSFLDKKIKPEYRSFLDNVIKDFYLPLLEDAYLYKRAVGFFSSTALIEISKGLTELVKNGGKILLIASPKLSDSDIQAIEKGYELRDQVIQRSLLNSFTEPKNYYEEERLNLLAHLIANGQLDIKLALMDNGQSIGMFHEKLGLIYDGNGNIVAFTGSMNETSSAFSHNYEAIDVFCSWTQDKERVSSKEMTFSMLWNDEEPNIRTLEFPKIAKEKLESYKKSYINLNMETDELSENRKLNTLKVVGPSIPKEIELHDYQLQAIDSWRNNNYRGIFDMATGTGKTFTGLGAVTQLYNDVNKYLAIIIVCPYQHLVEQWVKDIVMFGMKPIIGYSSSKQKNWKKRLQDAVISFNLKIDKHFCLITTNATFSSEFVQQQLRKIKRNVVLIIDEAHNFGSTHLSKTLNENIPYRLALSATIDRHNDEEGTEKLKNYFGKKCIEYSLKDAIDNNQLTPYYYYPIIVTLNESELERYKKITSEIFKHCSVDSKGNMKINESGKMLLIKRARIVAAASQKISKLSEIIQGHKNDNHMLIYCGAATLEDPAYVEGSASNEEKKQIDIVANMLGNKLGMRVSKFTSEESAEEREELKAVFAEGKHLQALIAIRCLDEGVNIPSIKQAFILASSTNPKEYIQRRGRVLRKFPGKEFASIFDFITLPVAIEDTFKLDENELRTIRSLANKEITRMKDFISISENPSIADKLIIEISNAFRLNEEGVKDYEI